MPRSCPNLILPLSGEWENSPEVTLVGVEDVGQAVMLCNSYSPHFTASLVSSDQHEHEKFYATIEAPFIGNGFTRWVDGQYALNAPELGLVRIGKADECSAEGQFCRVTACIPSAIAQQ